MLINYRKKIIFDRIKYFRILKFDKIIYIKVVFFFLKKLYIIFINCIVYVF